MHLVPFLEIANRVLASKVPGQIAQMDQPVNTALKADKYAKISNRFDAARHLVALFVKRGELFPGIRLALLHAKGNAAALRVDIKDHDLHFVAHLNHLVGMDILVRPVHLGDMHKAFDAFFNFNEGPVIGNIRHLAEHPRMLGIATRDIDPRVLAELFQPERNTVALAVVAQHLGLDFITDVQHFRRVLDPFPGEIGNMQQTVDTAEIDKGPVISQVLDHTLDDLPLFEIGQQLLALGRHLRFDHRPTGHDDIVAPTVNLDDLEFKILAFEIARIANGTHIDQRAWQKRAHTIDRHRKSTFDLAAHHTGHDRLLLKGLLQRLPGLGAAGLLTGKTGLAVTVFDLLDDHFNLVADMDGNLAAAVLEFAGGNDAFGLEAGMHGDKIIIHMDHLSGDQLAGLQIFVTETCFK